MASLYKHAQRGTVYVINENLLYLPTLFIHATAEKILPKTTADQQELYAFELLSFISFAFPWNSNENWMRLEQCTAAVLATRVNLLLMTTGGLRQVSTFPPALK